MNQAKPPSGTNLTGVAMISHSSARIRRLAWLPVPAYIVLIVILYITLPRELAASLVYDPPWLMLVSNTLFFFALSLAVFTTAMRAYLASGSSNILFLGYGVLALGCGALAGGWVRPLGGAANTSVTIHNLSALLGATLHAMSALLTLLKAEPEEIVGRRRLKFLFGFTGTLMLLIAITIATALGGIIPLFWAADVGSTPTMHAVLTMAGVLFALTSIYTMVLYFQSHRYFLWWYSIGLALTCVGLTGINVMEAVGGPIGWAGRTAQYVGGAYFLIATLSALREAHREGWSLEAAISNFYRQSEANYRNLVEMVGHAIISIDDRKRVLVWNPGAERILGYTPGEALGHVVSDLFMPEGHKERLDDELQNLQTGSMDPFAAKQLEIEMRRKDGTFFPSETSLSVRRIGSGWIATLLVRDITKRKQMEEALRESEDKYRTLVEQSLQGTWVIQDMHVVFCNQTFADMGGWTIPEVLSWSPEEVTNIIHPDDQKRVWGRFRERLEGKQLPLTNNQLRAFRRDGSIAWIEYDARRIIFSGRPAMLISVLDITKRREAEKALRESEEKYKTLAEQSLQGTFVIQDMRFVFCNQTFANMGGYTLEELYSLSPEEVMNIIHPDDQKRVWGRFRERMEGKQLPQECNELRAFRKDGSIAWVEYDAVMINYRGRPAMLVSIVEFTKRRDAEKALRESEQRYRQLAESAKDFIFIIDKEGKVRYVNSSAAQEFGCNPDQLLGKSVTDLFLPDTGKSQWDRIQEVIHSGQSLPNRETKVVFPRRELWLNTSLVPLRTENGKVNQVLGIARDVTEFKQAEEALRESEIRHRQLSEENARLLEQARQDAQTKTILLHEVNHRVKNNLASIIGLTQAQERFGKKKGSPEFRSMCRDLAGRVQGLATVHTLLSAAGWSSVKLADLATEVIHSTLQILPSHHRVSVQVSPSSIQVTPDQANTLALVINELATNTIKHGQRGKQASSISVRVEEDDGQVLFEFQDNGPGYPEPTLEEDHYNVGLDLVTNLVRNDLRGEVTLRNDHGAVTRIQFKNGGRERREERWAPRSRS